MPDEIDNFKRFLEVRALSKKTISCYSDMYKFFLRAVEEHGFNQITVDAFLISKNNNSVVRAFMKNYLEFLDNKDIKVVKRLTGKKPRKKPKHISQTELYKVVEYLMNNSFDERFSIMILLTYYCALRREEIINIRIRDFDLIRWKEEPDKPIILKIHGKFKKERFVVIPVSLMKIIKEFMIKRVDKIKSDDELLFKRTASRLSQKFRDACIKTLNKSYNLHSLRHSRALDWYHEGKDIFQIKSRLGHSSISTTQLYINPDEEEELKNWREEYC